MNPGIPKRKRSSCSSHKKVSLIGRWLSVKTSLVILYYNKRRASCSVTFTLRSVINFFFLSIHRRLPSMSSLARLQAIQERARAARAAGARPVLGGVPAGEVLGDPGGAFSTPGVGGSLGEEDSEEEGMEVQPRFAETASFKGEDESAVGLVFPRWGREVSVDEEWKWDLCGGLIGGKGSNRFCIKPLVDKGVSHCGTGSHAFKKAQLHEGFGYIPSTGDRTNTRSAFLSPSVDAGSLPEAYMESLQNTLSPDKWISYFAMLPAHSELDEFDVDHQEAAAATLTKASRAVSFSYTPASKRPRLTDLIAGPVGASVNLASRFKEEGAAGKADLFSEDLEANISDEWNEGGEGDSSAPPFSPTILQWNQLVKRVSSLTLDLEEARSALLRVAAESENHMESLDDQVINLRGSVGRRPTSLGPTVPGMELWTSMVGVCDTLHSVKSKVDRPVPTPHEISTRDLANSAGKDAKLAIEGIARLETSKTDLASKHTPLEAVVTGIVSDLYEPDGMYNHLLTFSEGGVPTHPTAQYQADFVKLQKEVETITLMNGFGLSNVDPSDPVITGMKANIRSLVSGMKTIKASLGGEVVRVDTETFHSADEVEVWVIDNMGSDSAFPDFFYDVVSMLEAIQDSSKTSDEMLGSQAGSIKAGHKGLSASRMLNSFCVTIPQVLGKKGNGSEIAAASYDKWKSHDGRTGVVEIVRKSMENWKHRTEGLLNTRFSSTKRFKVLMLARSMMSDSINFWTSLVVWVDSFYNRLVNQAEREGPGGDASLPDRKEYDTNLANSKKEAWKLVVNVLTDIFSELAIRRSDGQAAQGMGDEPSMQCAIILYSSLKAHKFMAELLERGFEKHAVMAPTFNGFLFTERASHGDVKRLELKIGELSTSFKALQGRMDKAKK
jgi:hypothetical protein